ncbi:hypothetical protein GCM10017784_39520 [Deinococcus indicus]|nr:hypothetical protein GCM10017784_39520 [Deinococcus indicus]
MKGLQSPPGPSGCDSESCPAEQEKNAPPDVEPAGAVKFRIAGETNGKSFHACWSRVPHDVMTAQRRGNVGQHVMFPVAPRREFLAATGSSPPEQLGNERLGIEKREGGSSRMSCGARRREQKRAECWADR